MMDGCGGRAVSLEVLRSKSLVKKVVCSGRGGNDAGDFSCWSVFSSV